MEEETKYIELMVINDHLMVGIRVHILLSCTERYNVISVFFSYKLCTYDIINAVVSTHMDDVMVK